MRPLWIFIAALGIVPPAASAREPAQQALSIPADQAWTDTKIDVTPSTPLHLEASGSCRISRLRFADWLLGAGGDRVVGPQGTYVWPRRYAPQGPFPMPAMAEGPTPAFALIGKIGDDGPPFYVGQRYDGIAGRAGRLWLGLNDDQIAGNRGHFRVEVELASLPSTPAVSAPVLEPDLDKGSPVPDARVLLLYVDGLRADVLHEMAEAGFLPNFKAVFLDRGLEVGNAFTVFPSNTLISNGSLFTGRFSDGTGIKSQNQFERTTLKPRGQLSAWLPDGFMPQPSTHVLDLLDKYAPESTHTFLVQRGVPTLGTRLGKAYRFTTLPIAPLNPPPLWLHRAINTIGPFGLSTQLPSRLDVVNAQYAVEEMLGDPDARVIAVWLPMVDKRCHHSARGQFGAARRDLALADRYLGRILERLRQVRWDGSTYLVLVSDHGHMGGESRVNRACNLPRDWAHRTLGSNARVVGQEWTHPGIDPARFVFFDNQGSGQAKMFLPYGSLLSGPWRRNRLYELTHYELRGGQRNVNLLASLKAFRPEAWREGEPPPVDLILIKLDDRRVLVYRDEENQAIIHREEGAGGAERYRYEPIRRAAQSEDGAFRLDSPAVGVDPLGYLSETGPGHHAQDPAWWIQPHTAQEWLEATAHTRYPDAVVAMAKFFAWKPPVEDLADARDPDVLVTASPGWSFRSDDGLGTDHGYPLQHSMRICFFIAGPNVRHGVLTRPHRIVDVLPTVLEMAGWSYDPQEFDGRAVTGIYEE